MSKNSTNLCLLADVRCPNQPLWADGSGSCGSWREVRALRAALAPRGPWCSGPCCPLRGEPGPLLPWDHLPAPPFPVSHPQGPFPPVSDEVSGARRGTGGRGCYTARPVSNRTEAAFTMARLRYGGSLARLTAPAPGSSSPLSLQQSCLPLSRGRYSGFPSTLGPWPRLCTHLPTGKEPLASALRPPCTGLSSRWARSPSPVMWTPGHVVPSSCS